MPCPAGVLLVALATPSFSPADPADDAPVWSVLPLDDLRSEGGATFELQGDGSVLAGGTNADKDVYVAVIDTRLVGITGLRLEVIPDDRLPKGGPGRAGQGNFVLSRLTLESAPPRSSRFTPVKLVRPSANHSQDSKDVTGLVDGLLNTGWSIFPEMGKAHEAVVTTAAPIDHRFGARLRVTFDFHFGGGHNLGRFRLSATTAEGPLLADGATPPDAWHEVGQQVGIAIDKGVDFLLDTQEIDGSWRYHQDKYPTGQTALSVYALLKCGVDRDHPAVTRAFTFMRGHSSGRTYEIACRIMAFLALGDPQDEERIEEEVERLISWQRPNGGYGYPDGAPDMSNTQYAALALHRAAEARIRVESDVWEKLADFTLQHQTQIKSPYAPAGFRYRGNDGVTGSMTAAGTTILAICELHMSRKRGAVVHGKQRGLKWLEDFFTVRNNPKPPDGAHDNWLYYYLYGLERVGGITGLARFGEHDWYREGARFMVDKQKKTGAWTDHDKGQADTAFALLFLNRATAPTTGSRVPGARSYGSDDAAKDVSMRAAGDTPLSMWVSSFGDRVADELTWTDEESKGPRVLRVDYFVVADEEFDEPVKVGSVDGNPKRPAGPERFAMQHSFSSPGVYRVWTEVTLQLEPLDGETLDEAVCVIASDPLDVSVRAAADPMLARYAGDPSRNVLTRTRVLARASSELNDGHKAALAHDNLVSRGWTSQDDDRQPSIVLDLERPARADTLLLLPSTTKDEKRTGRPTVVRVQINRKKTLEVDMETDPLKKTVVSLGKPMRIQQLAVTVLEKSPSEKGGVGFAEIELQDSREKPGRKRR